MGSNILNMLETELPYIAYKDIMPVVAVLMSSGLRSARVVRLI